MCLHPVRPGQQGRILVGQIIDSLGRNWWIVEGATNRNVCLEMATGACAKALEQLGIAIGGKTWPWKEYAFGKYLGLKTDYRTFWYVR